MFYWCHTMFYWCGRAAAPCAIGAPSTWLRVADPPGHTHTGISMFYCCMFVGGQLHVTISWDLAGYLDFGPAGAGSGSWCARASCGFDPDAPLAQPLVVDGWVPPLPSPTTPQASSLRVG